MGCSSAISKSILAPYTEKGTLERKFNASGIKTVVIDNYASDVTIAQTSGTDEIRVVINREVRGKDKAAVKEAFEKVDYEWSSFFGTGTVKSKSFKILNSKVNSLNNDMTIYIPSSIQIIKTKSQTGNVVFNGNLDTLEVAIEVGDLKVKGNVKSIKTTTETGDVNFDGIATKSDIAVTVGDIRWFQRQVLPSYSLTFKPNTTDVTLNLPKNSVISYKDHEDIVKSGSTIKNDRSGMPVTFVMKDFVSIKIAEF